MKASTRLFIDSSAWVAVFCKDDGCHQRALEYWQRVCGHRRFLLTSDYVLDETYTLLRRRRNGLRMAIAFHDLVNSSKVIEIASVDESLSKEAWRIFVRYEDKVMSFTDCTSFALMRQRKLLEAFSFDDDFQRAGFVMQPGADCEE